MEGEPTTTGPSEKGLRERLIDEITVLRQARIAKEAPKKAKKKATSKPITKPVVVITNN